MVAFIKIAGGRICGYSGDGGLAGNAEIGSSIGQIVFDAAGDMYFSDTNNQRVRRIDYDTGVIRTIAGDGTAGYTGDGGKATSATLHIPTGVGVDSQGNVYIISSAATGQVIRKVRSPGLLGFGNQAKGAASAAQLFTITDTGDLGDDPAPTTSSPGQTRPTSKSTIRRPLACSRPVPRCTRAKPAGLGSSSRLQEPAHGQPR